MLSASRGALVALQARDFERAVAFYKEVLELPMTFRHESYWAEFQAPGLSIGIEAAGDDAVVGGGTISLCFEVRGIERVVDGLRSRGVSFLGPVRDTFHGREAYFADSEGNPIVLHESANAQASATPAGAKKAVGKRARAKEAVPAAKTRASVGPGKRASGAKAGKRPVAAKAKTPKGAASGRAAAKKGAPTKRKSSSRGGSSRRGRR